MDRRNHLKKDAMFDGTRAPYRRPKGPGWAGAAIFRRRPPVMVVALRENDDFRATI
jgi:hypothetical protein